MTESSENINDRQVPSGARRSFPASLARFLLLACLACIAFGGGLAYRSYVLNLEKLKNYDPPEPTPIFADNGELMAEFAQERRYVVPLREIPQPLQDAFLSEEEKLLSKPPRASVSAFIRAAVELRPREFVRTIEEDLVWEAVKALTTEQKLYIHLNQIYLGSSAYGVEAAARTCFGKSVKDLTIAECAMIAGLVKAPRYSPKRDMQRALERRNDVLQRMLELGKITRAEYEQAAHEEPVLVERNLPAPNLRDFIEQVRKHLVYKFGVDMLYKGGLKVYTTLDPARAETAQQMIPSSGYPVQHTYIKRIVDKRGKVLEDNLPGSH